MSHIASTTRTYLQALWDPSDELCCMCAPAIPVSIHLSSPEPLSKIIRIKALRILGHEFDLWCILKTSITFIILSPFDYQIEWSMVIWCKTYTLLYIQRTEATQSASKPTTKKEKWTCQFDRETWFVEELKMFSLLLIFLISSYLKLVLSFLLLSSYQNLKA